MLGEWEDELDGHHMVNTWTSGGPKHYAYELSNRSKTCKVKGFSLKRAEISQLINYESVKKLVSERYHDENRESHVLTSQSMIIRDKKHALLKTVEQQKTLKVEYTKGEVVVRGDGTVETLPFGYLT